MQVVSITKAKINFYKLIEKVLKGEEIIITKYGKPGAKISRLFIIRKYLEIEFILVRILSV